MISIRSLTKAAIIAATAALVATAAPAPAQAYGWLPPGSTVCTIGVALKIGGDDLRGNTKVKIGVGNSHALIDGGIGNRSIGVRTVSLSTCVPLSTVNSTGFTLTSLSNPSWPETTDNWNLDGISIWDAANGRPLFFAERPGSRIKRFTGSSPVWQTGPLSVPYAGVFQDRRNASCPGSSAFIRFRDSWGASPATLDVTITPHNSTSQATMEASYDAFLREWGGDVARLGVNPAYDPFPVLFATSNSAFAFHARSSDGAPVATATLGRGCNAHGLSNF